MSLFSPRSAPGKPVAPAPPFAHDFLTGGGEMGARMRAHDWSTSPLGPPETWPQSLRTVVSLLLNSKFPMFLAWGPKLGFLYNDGYLPIFGTKHPHALGLPFQEVWSEIWADISPLVDRALSGEGTFSENFHLVMERNGYPEDTWFTFSYSPIRDESGGIGGMFCACTETTSQVLAEAALRGSEAQLRALADNLPYGMVYQMALRRDGSARRFTFVSQSSQRLSGVAPEAALRDPMALYETILPEYHAALAAAEETAIGRREPMDVEVGFRRADGSPGWCRIISAPRPGPDDSILWDGLFVDITEGRQAEAALRESEDHYRHTVELNPQVPWTSAPDGQLDHVSKRWLDWTGTTGLGETWEQAVHPDDLGPSIAAWTRSVATGEPYDIEHRIRLRGGEYHWMHSRAFPRRDEQGRIVKWYGTTEDIQESKAAAERLRESEARLSALFAQAAAGIAQVDLSGRFTLVNDRYCELVGRSREELAGLRMQDITHPADLAVNAPLFAAVVRGGSAFDIEKRYVRPDGSTIWVRNSVTALRAPDGTVESVLAVSTDITDRKNAETALRESEARFRNMADNAPVMVWTTDASGHCTYLNRSWYEFTGQTPENALGFGWVDATHPDDKAKAETAFRSAHAQRAPFRVEYRLRRHDGEYGWAIDTAAPRFGEDGAFLGYIGSVIDITERKRLEEHQSLLINELNHRVKNTLATVQSIAAQTFRHAPTMDEARNAFESRLLALSRAHDVLTRENWEGANLREIVAQAVEPYSHHREDRLHLAGRDIRLPPRMALALSMALQELATNAVKYGALANGTGEIEIGWTLDRKAIPPLLRLQWREKGGPPVMPPQRRGFGSRLIERSLAQDLDGDVRIDFAPTGVVCTIEAPVARFT